MAYQVRLTHDTDANDRVTKSYLTYAQAVYGMKLRAYETLAAFGLLDTQSAHDVMAKIDAGFAFVMISNTGYALYRREFKKRGTNNG